MGVNQEKVHAATANEVTPGVPVPVPVKTANSAANALVRDDTISISTDHQSANKEPSLDPLGNEIPVATGAGAGGDYVLFRTSAVSVLLAAALAVINTNANLQQTVAQFRLDTIPVFIEMNKQKAKHTKNALMQQRNEAMVGAIVTGVSAGVGIGFAATSAYKGWNYTKNNKTFRDQIFDKKSEHLGGPGSKVKLGDTPGTTTTPTRDGLGQLQPSTSNPRQQGMEMQELSSRPRLENDELGLEVRPAETTAGSKKADAKKKVPAFEQAKIDQLEHELEQNGRNQSTWNTTAQSMAGLLGNASQGGQSAARAVYTSRQAREEANKIRSEAGEQEASQSEATGRNLFDEITRQSEAIKSQATGDIGALVRAQQVV